MRSRAARIAAHAALALLAPLLLWGVAEGLAALAGIEAGPGSRPAMRSLRHRRCQFGWGDAARLCDPALVPRAGRRLVIALGGSSVVGYPEGAEIAFPARLGALLEAAAPGAYQVVNFGQRCKDSLFVRDCARAVAPTQPWAFVVYAGHNDFANWLAAPGQRIWLERNAWIYDLEVALLRSRAFSALWRSLQSGPVDAPPDARAPEPLAAGRARVLEQYEADLLDVIATARSVGARLLWVTVVSNLHEHPVKRAAWPVAPQRRVAREPALAAWGERYREGIREFGAGRFDAALAAFKAARDLLPAGRAPGALNDLARRIAAEHPDVELVDFERSLDRLGAEEGIGCSWFGGDDWCDQFHPNRRTHALIAAAVFERLVAQEAPADPD